MSEDTASGKYTDPLSLNKYTYCHNQPVTGYDPDGHFLHILGGALLGGVIGAGASMISQLREKGSIDLRETLGSAAEGAIVGGAAATTGGASLAVSVAAGAEAGAAGNFVNQWISKGSLSKIDTTQVFTSAAANAMGEVGGKLGESLLKKGGQIAGKFLGTAGKEAAAKAGGSVVQKGLKECFKTGFKCGVGATTYDIASQAAGGKGLTDIDWKEVGASAAIGFGLGMGAKALSNSKLGEKINSASESVGKKLNSAGEKIGEKLSTGLESLKETGKALAANNDGFMDYEAMFGKKLTSKLAGGGSQADVNTGRGRNNIKPDTNARGAHSVYKRDTNTGKITNYKTYMPNPKNPSGFDETIGYDGVGKPHLNKGTGESIMPHVHDKTVSGGVRTPYPFEIPN